MKSRPEKGATFDIFLPRYKDAAAVQGGANENIPLGNGETILVVVEDETSILNWFKPCSKTEIYRYWIETSPRAALIWLKPETARFTALNTDLDHAGMNGRELARQWLRFILKSGCCSCPVTPPMTLPARAGVSEQATFIQKRFPYRTLPEKSMKPDRS